LGRGTRACDTLNNGGSHRSRSFGLDQMGFEVGYLGGMEVGTRVLATSYDVVAGFVSAQAAGAGVGVVGVNAVSDSADG
jgi:hypothetical protein